MAAILALPATAQEVPTLGADSAPPQQVDGPTISTLIRTALIALDQANQTGNYTVLRDLGASAMQASNSAADLAKLFAGYRENHLSLAATVLFDPALDKPPELGTDGTLHLVGHFPTQPQEVMFDLTFFFERGLWRIANMQIGTRAAGAAGAPGAPAGKPSALSVPLPRVRPAKP